MKIKYIVRLKSDKKLEYTTINRDFCGELITDGPQMVFKLNGSGALVIIPFDWIEYMAPSKVHWELEREAKILEKIYPSLDTSGKIK